MGPRPDGRGKTTPRDGLLEVYLASMGPRPDGRGKGYCAGRAAAAAGRQWGRGQTAAERITTEKDMKDADPRQWGRGQTAAESPPRARNGQVPRPRQWGRGQTAAESGHQR